MRLHPTPDSGNGCAVVLIAAAGSLLIVATYVVSLVAGGA